MEIYFQFQFIALDLTIHKSKILRNDLIEQETS